MLYSHRSKKLHYMITLFHRKRFCLKINPSPHKFLDLKILSYYKIKSSSLPSFLKQSIELGIAFFSML